MSTAQQLGLIGNSIKVQSLPTASAETFGAGNRFYTLIGQQEGYITGHTYHTVVANDVYSWEDVAQAGPQGEDGLPALVCNDMWGFLKVGLSNARTETFNRTPIVGEKVVIFSTENQYALATIESVSETTVGVRFSGPIISTKGATGQQGPAGAAGVGINTLSGLKLQTGQGTVFYDTTNGVSIESNGQATYNEQTHEFITNMSVPIVAGNGISIDVAETKDKVTIKSTLQRFDYSGNFAKDTIATVAYRIVRIINKAVSIQRVDLFLSSDGSTQESMSFSSQMSIVMPSQSDLYGKVVGIPARINDSHSIDEASKERTIEFFIHNVLDGTGECQWVRKTYRAYNTSDNTEITDMIDYVDNNAATQLPQEITSFRIRYYAYAEVV